jgi:hypothetical protein
MRGEFEDCEEAAAAGGLAAGLAAALAGAGVGRPPGRIAALPADQVPDGASVVPHRLADLEGIRFVRAQSAERDEDGRLAVFAALLGAVRLAVTRRLLDHAVGHLAGRTSGGEPTLRRQLVLGTLADVFTGIEAARQSLLVAGHVPAAVADAHDRVTELDWETAKLLGASGYLADGPARGAYVSRLTANCWIPRQGGVL